VEKIVEMKNITKIFPGTVANDDISIDLYKGETHVLLGENGAGKTTLMNVLYGLYQAEKGEIFVRGTKVNIRDSSDAIKLGIGMVHQHFMLVHNFTVTENIILGHEPTSGLVVNIKKAEKDVQDIAKKYGFNVKYDSLISDITVGQQQKVEIIKALYRGADILILDEPTAVLTPQEIDELAIIIDNLKKEGKSVILITHKLKEIMKMSDRVTIIRRGKVIDSIFTKDVNINILAEMMVGRKVNLSVEKKEAHPKEEVLKVNYLNYIDKRGVKVIDELTLSVRSGEILGIAGVDGNGQSEFVEILAGFLRASGGSVKIDDNEIIEKNSEDIIKLRFGHVPEDRQKRGLLLKFPLYENAVLGMHKDKKFSNGTILKYNKIKKHTNEIIKEFDVRTPNENVNAETLSGGNQQKLIVGREIFKDPRLLVVSQPTRGLDVGAIEYIHRRLIQERDKGIAILLVSFELDEILDLSDRIAVMYGGRIVSVMDRKDADEYKLGRLMAGGKA